MTADHTMTLWEKLCIYIKGHPVVQYSLMAVLLLILVLHACLFAIPENSIRVNMLMNGYGVDAVLYAKISKSETEKHTYLVSHDGQTSKYLSTPINMTPHTREITEKNNSYNIDHSTPPV